MQFVHAIILLLLHFLSFSFNIYFFSPFFFLGSSEQARVGLVQVCVYTLMVLSGERNFAVRLNKPFVPAFTMDIPAFDGHYGDLLVLVRTSRQSKKKN
jgi:hypothetical protein